MYPWGMDDNLLMMNRRATLLLKRFTELLMAWIDWAPLYLHRRMICDQQILAFGNLLASQPNSDTTNSNKSLQPNATMSLPPRCTMMATAVIHRYGSRLSKHFLRSVSRHPV